MEVKWRNLFQQRVVNQNIPDLSNRNLDQTGKLFLLPSTASLITRHLILLHLYNQNARVLDTVERRTVPSSTHRHALFSS